MRRHFLTVALLTSVAAFTTPAVAADLGGDCCADLEERISELEATTVRKGNRKVSVAISGWVAEQVMFWDDGTESNVYVTGLGTTLSSHFKLTGSAQIAPGWQAGYVVHIEANAADPLAVDQDRDDALLTGTTHNLQTYWYLSSEKYGKVSVGLVSQASDNTAILVDGSGSLVPANWVIFDNVSFKLRDGAGNFINVGGADLRWADVAMCHHIDAGIGADCNGVPLNAVRYDSPTFGGFSVSASWGEDDFWDVAVRYAGEFNGVKVAIAGAYSNSTEGLGDTGLGGGHESDYYQIGAYVQHTPTGLFLYGAYGREENEHRTANLGLAIPDSDFYYLKAGLRRKFHPLGHTVLFGEYGQHDDMMSQALIEDGVTGTEMQRWGLGIVQEIDAAAMSLFLVYRNIEGDIDNLGGAVNVDLDELQIVKFGALINF
ncbi:MAG: porin [Hyphomicrobiaceae bacterium]|nr:porin [Hyphomicrobiaceae bacterium]